MSKRLEDFIRENRAQFDADEPSPQVWNKLQAQVTPQPEKGKVIAMKLLRLGIAAAIVVLAGVGVFFLLNNDRNNNGIVHQGKQPGAAIDTLLQEIDPQYAQEVYHFTRLIELKQTELQQIEKDNPELYKRFIGDINKLDSSYNALKNELPANPNPEQLLEAMIQNLQLQTDLLNQQLSIIKQIKQSKNKSRETSHL